MGTTSPCHLRGSWGPQPAPTCCSLLRRELRTWVVFIVGLTTYDDDRVLSHCLHDHLFFLSQRELGAFQPLFPRERGSQNSGNGGRGACSRCRRADRMRGLCSKQDYTGDVVPTAQLAPVKGNSVAPLEDGSLDGWGGAREIRSRMSHLASKGSACTEKPPYAQEPSCCWGVHTYGRVNSANNRVIY